MISGYKVPNSTAAMATTNSTLLSSKNDSREPTTGWELLAHCGARQANKASDTPTTTDKNSKMKMPRPGSVAKACTEVNTPERTRKVPSKLSENPPMANSTVQALNCPRLSVTMSEWIKAVATSQGMSEAFSTGSQNHQPPQPNS